MKSYLRFLSRNKLYTAIMAVGLSVSLAFALLIGTYVWQQYYASRNVNDYERIYSVVRERSGNKYMGVHLSVAGRLKENIPEIESVCRFYDIQDTPVQIEGHMVLAERISVDKDFFEMFECWFIEGNAEIMDDKSNIIVSESFANRYGGPEEVIGMKVSNFIVGAVIKDFDDSMFSNYDIIQNIDLRGDRLPAYINDTYTFLKLKKGVRYTDVDGKIEAEIKKIWDSAPFPIDYKAVLMSYRDVFFSSEIDYNDSLNNCDKKHLCTMAFVVLLLFFSAMVNFINLSSAMSGKRMKEVATRMISGGDASSIFLKYVTETVFFSMFCVVCAVFMAFLILPHMNNLIHSDIPIQISLSPISILLYVITAIIIGLVASIVPASIGLSVHPIDVLKGQFRTNSKMIFSKIFIVLQNAVSVVLIALAINMNMQIKYLASRPIGADTEDLYYLWLDDINARAPLEEELKKLTFVRGVGLSEGYPGGTIATGVESDADGNRVDIGYIVCDTKAFEMYNFRKSSDNGHDIANSVWSDQKTYNIMASQGMQLDDPESTKYIWIARSDSKFGGILEEFALTDPLGINNDMLCWVYVTEAEQFTPFQSEGAALLIHTTGDHAENRKAIIEVHKQICEEKYGIYIEPLYNGYINDMVAQQLHDVENRTKVMNIFMFLSILLSFMGFVAMSTYFSSESRSDIAIRKVYGSTVEDETIGNVWKYMRIVIVSCIIAVPIAVYACNRFLGSFVYRIDNHWWVYTLAVLLALLISLAAVFVQVSRAARTNPAEALKKE